MYPFSFIKEFAAKEKLEIVIGAAEPRAVVALFCHRLRRQNGFELFSVSCTKIKPPL